MSEQVTSRLYMRWRQYADYVLAVLVGEAQHGQDKHETIALGRGFSKEQLPPPDPEKPHRDARAVLEALYTAKQNNLVPSLTVLLGYAPAQTEYLSELFAVYGRGTTSSLTGKAFEANLEILLECARRAQIISAIQRAIVQLNAPATRTDAVLGELGERIDLAGRSAVRTEGESGTSLGDELLAHMQRDPLPLKPLGIEPLDRWTDGGLLPGRCLTIVAREKQRKTTVALNIMLNYLLAGGAVTICMLENNRRVIAWTMVAMLAVKDIRERGLFDAPSRPGSIIKAHEISAALLERNAGNIRNWADDARVPSIMKAIEQLRSFGPRLRIYDKTARGGGIETLPDLDRVMRRDLRVYGTPDIVMIDHAQNAGNPLREISDYEKLMQFGGWAESFCRANTVSMCILAQKKAGDTGDGIDVRGGSRLAELSDLVLGLRYDEEDVNYVHLYVGASRQGPGGMRDKVRIEPKSGLIIPESKEFVVEREIQSTEKVLALL